MEECGKRGRLVTFSVRNRRLELQKHVVLQKQIERFGALGGVTMGSNTGRPSLYSDALAEKIVELIADGYSERQIEAMEGMPSRRTMLRWKAERPEFCRLSARAREASADLFNDRRIEAVRRLTQIADAACAKNEDIPDGAVKGFKLFIQECAREAALRDDSRFGNRRRVALEASQSVGIGLQAFYSQLKDELRAQEEREACAGVA